MDNIQAIRDRLDELDESQKKRTVGGKAMEQVASAMIDFLHVMGGEHRMKLLETMHQALIGLVGIPPMQITKLIIAELADEHASERITKRKLDSLMHDEVIPADLQERIDSVCQAQDRDRIDGVKRLQAFLKIRPVLVEEMKKLGVDDPWMTPGGGGDDAKPAQKS